MAKQIYQFRYYDDNNPLNCPVNATSEDWASSSTETPSAKAFTDFTSEAGAVLPQKASIVQLGIQTIPGTKFYLNGSKYPTTVGVTGIYEISLDDEVTIESLVFNKISMERIKENEGAYLIVDMLVRKEDY